ncbi:bifunctional transcriptional activator/DNA repair enzyme AdaA [Paenibacillus methanolicus]|uniref:AraC family transcriptional regulator of adaptative response / methylphosphotriester-DNA alkyltransferase methyltransferase n=1 Tax=Paenibacillus methanolicus TaxID=582686 RepID=A0A5S5CLG3_9BACL|nr:Ada metal-binding domain-containing protein [Paenibacillus methanolicus]TYP79697.1 AraC family transcriptional regulator of adaptative response / methylphosphotriester-DNA alkyltransferase methyltransferase [Paenibacillus methanolicus]
MRSNESGSNGGERDRPREGRPASDQQWDAIIACDGASNGTFFYAVKTTRIFCRPSCKSREPKRDHVLVFDDARDAAGAGFRACKRCKPTGERMPDQEWVHQMTDYIDAHLQEDLSLESLSQVCHGSVFHMHRTFKRLQGVTPIVYIQHRRIAEARSLLAQSGLSISEVAANVGLTNVPYFTTLFKRKTGMTPAEFRTTMQKIEPSGKEG